MKQKHLTEERLIDLCLAGAPAVDEDAHLAQCGTCELRRLELAGLLDEVDAAADADVDAHFPADRLARQRARILQQIEHDGRPGRLLSFPTAAPPPAMDMRARPRARWAAAGVAAAFVIGMLTGHLAHDLPVSDTLRDTTAPRIVSNERDMAPLRAVSTTWSDEEFLAQIERAGGQLPSALGTLDAMTPRAWEVAR